MAMKRLRGRDSDSGGIAEAPVSPPEAGQQKDSSVKPCTFIDEGSEISGQLRFSEPVTIDGRIQGEIECQKSVVISEAANVNSTISCDSVVVYGELHGEVDAKTMVTIHKSARVTAQIKTASVVIERGSKFKGLIQVDSDDDFKPAAGPASPAYPSVKSATDPADSGDK